MLKKIVFPKAEKKPVTVIFAAKESNESLLLGADTCMTDGYGIRHTVHKLRRLANTGVAWGCGGNDDLGKEYSSWLENYRWPPETWNVFEDEIRGKLGDLNGKQHDFCKRSGIDWEPDKGATCLLVAIFQGQLHMDAYNYTGEKTSYLEDEYGVIGSGGFSIIVAWEALKGIETVKGVNLNIPFLERFRYLLCMTAFSINYCAEPVDIWRIRENNIEVLGTQP